MAVDVHALCLPQTQASGKQKNKYWYPLFLRIQLVHLCPCRCLAFLGVWCGYAVGETVLIYLKLKASTLVIIGELAQLRVLFRKGKEPILEAGVIGADRSPLVSLIKIYLGRFMRFLDTCNHIIQKPPVFPSREKHPHFGSKKPRSVSALFAIFLTAWLSSGMASFTALKIAESPYFVGVHRK